jgi:two-component system, NtrC family, nitrogen regulation sensor histidine kinase GlnL
VAGAGPDPGAILAALPGPILVVDGGGGITFANPAAEQFFGMGRAVLARQKLADLVPFGSPLLNLIAQVQSAGNAISEYGLDLRTPRTGGGVVDAQVMPLAEVSGGVVVRLETRGMHRSIDRQLSLRGAVRSVVGAAQVLAHEVKNPLSGIRGAAQLLEANLDANDRRLTELIRDEVDRVCALVDRMEAFAESGPLRRRPLNIHEVLDRVRRLAESGFGRHVRFVERYDPSLPAILGDRDQLIQVFLNLVKNAAEAAPEVGGEVILATAYRSGMRLVIPGGRERVRLPLEVSVQDNGPGVPEDLRPHIFDPFVTTKPAGTGLGLALVAKSIGDHGGIVDCDSRPGQTVFRVRLPVLEHGMEEPNA